MNEHGLVKIPSLRAVPDFNVEALLSSVEQFVLDPVCEASKHHKLSRQQLQALLADASNSKGAGSSHPGPDE